MRVVFSENPSYATAGGRFQRHPRQAIDHLQTCWPQEDRDIDDGRMNGMTCPPRPCGVMRPVNAGREIDLSCHTGIAHN